MISEKIVSIRASLFSYVMARVHNADTADEIVQNAVLRLLGNMEAIPADHDGFIKFCFRVTLNETAEYFRRKARYAREQQGGNDEILESVPEACDDWQVFIRSMLRWAIKNGQNLTPNESRVLNCSITMEDDGIQQMLDMSNASVRKHRSCGIAKLRQQFADNDLHDEFREWIEID